MDAGSSEANKALSVFRIALVACVFAEARSLPTPVVNFSKDFSKVKSAGDPDLRAAVNSIGLPASSTSISENSFDPNFSIIA